LDRMRGFLKQVKQLVSAISQQLKTPIFCSIDKLGG